MGKVADVLTEDEQLLILDYRIVTAVKAIRERTGVDLRTAKGLVDKYGEEEGLKEDRPCTVCEGKGKFRDWKEPVKAG